MLFVELDQSESNHQSDLIPTKSNLTMNQFSRENTGFIVEKRFGAHTMCESFLKSLSQ